MNVMGSFDREGAPEWQWCMTQEIRQDFLRRFRKRLF